MNKIDGLVFRCVLSRHQQFHRADFPLRMLRQMAAVMMAHEAGISLLADPGRRTSGYRRLWPWLCRRLPGLDKNALRRWTQSRRRCRRISWQTRIKRAAFDFSCSWCRERSTRFPRNEHVFILALFASGWSSRVSQKVPLSRVRAVLNPGFLALLLWDRQINADSSRHDHSESLKNPLHAVQYLSGENVAARIQRERNGTVSLRGKRP